MGVSEGYVVAFLTDVRNWVWHRLPYSFEASVEFEIWTHRPPVPTLLPLCSSMSMTRRRNRRRCHPPQSQHHANCA